jgi:hypothetical protein
MNCRGFVQFTARFKPRAPWRKGLEVEAGSVLFLLPVCIPGGVANRGLTVGKHCLEGEQLRVEPKKFIKISNRSKKATKNFLFVSYLFTWEWEFSWRDLVTFMKQTRSKLGAEWEWMGSLVGVDS